MRYNMYSAAAVTGSLAPGTSSGEGVALMDQHQRRGPCRRRWPPTGPS